MFADICHTPLDFESPPWDTLSGGREWMARHMSGLTASPSITPLPYAACQRHWSPAASASSPCPAADARDFVQRLLHRDEWRRPSAAEALQHPWLQDEAQQAGGDAPLGASIVQRLQRFGTYSRLKRAALRTVASHVPQVRRRRAARAAGCCPGPRAAPCPHPSCPSQPPRKQDSIVVQGLRGLFLELDPLDTGRVSYTRLQQELEVRGAALLRLLGRTPAGQR